eukprot:TRINITY_DN14263_c0_g1_i4.p2 TRINITY_DN14263_c0_g1~~TRINITY_DN14263_c0_g1_i4.p2  ORF type:complete len:128 (-),score=25.72 TRINITY_DN14263_c0_g1_i4:26-409(-)
MTFPERVHYSRADGAGWPIKDWATANQLLGYLNAVRNHFVVFELPDHSYIQCLGSKTALTHVLCVDTCLLYTSDAADDMQCVDLGGRRIIKKKKKEIRKKDTITKKKKKKQRKCEKENEKRKRKQKT